MYSFADASAVNDSTTDRKAGRMQAEAADSSLREGIEALGVKDTDNSAAAGKDHENAEHHDAEMTDATEEDSAAKDGTSNHRRIHGKTVIGIGCLKLFVFIIQTVYFSVKDSPSIRMQSLKGLVPT